MPRSVLAGNGAEGIVTYQLGQTESFQLLALTVLLTNPDPLDDDQCYLDCRTPTDEVIYRQYVGTAHNWPNYLSLAPLSEPWTALNAGSGTFPQSEGEISGVFTNQRMAPVTLTGKCTVNVYIALGSQPVPAQPISGLDTNGVPVGLHLWVEDAPGSQALPPNPPPLLTHLAA
jgi:hypothetical protein